MSSVPPPLPLQHVQPVPPQQDFVPNISNPTDLSFDSDADSFSSTDNDVAIEGEGYYDSDSSLSSAVGDQLLSHHTDSDDLDEELDIDESMFEPLFDNASITVCGAYCAIMEFKRACRLPFTTIDMLLKLLQLLCPPNNHLPQSIYKFKTFFEKFSSSHQKQQFCSDCKTEFRENQSKCDNLSCRHVEPSTLISFNPEKAIRRVLKSTFGQVHHIQYIIFVLLCIGNWNKLVCPVYQGSILYDIHNGAGFKGIQHGLIFNTDGISPYKSSRITVWPILIALSDLPPGLRMNKDNVITVALWVGESKPPMDVFFKPLTLLITRLSTVGVKLKAPIIGQKTIKFKPLFGSFDLVAKAPVLNMHQFNGKNGCSTCLNPGEWNGSRYYLPHSTMSYASRTNDSVMKAAEDAEKKKTIIDGIKGKSVLTNVVDLVAGVPMDYMHCVLEGVMKWLIEKWFNSSSHGSPYYIGRSVKKVDSYLLYQSPPHDFSRAPRSIEKHRRFWKASEQRNFLLYYSLPILSSILPPLYFHHYSLLVCAMHILLQSKLTEIQIQAAEVMLFDYYKLLPELYGEKSCTLNAHSLTHLTAYVRLWGPLWTHSLFGFESMNGHLTSMIHSKRKIAEQLLFSIDVCQTVGNLADRLTNIEDDVTLSFFAPLSASFSQRRKNMTLILPGVYSIGKMQSCSFGQSEISAIQKITVVSSGMLTFDKLYIKETMLYSVCYKGKRDSSICCYVENGEKKYGTIQKYILAPPIVLLKPFKKTSTSLLFSTGNPCRARLQRYADADLLSTFIVQVFDETLPLCAIPMSTLCCKCVKISFPDSNHSFIVHIPNNFEHH